MPVSVIGRALIGYTQREYSISDLAGIAQRSVAVDADQAQAIETEFDSALREGILTTEDHRFLMDALTNAQVHTGDNPSPGEASRRPGTESELNSRPVEPGPGSARASAASNAASAPPASGANAAVKAMATPLRIGDVLNRRFELEASIGEGGMGRVFRAKDHLKVRAGDRDPFVVLKVLSDAFRAQPDSLVALQREARNAQRLSHPNIVRVHDFGYDEASDHYYIVMEYLRGEPLDRYLAANASFFGLPIDTVWPIVEGTGQALAYAHEQGIIHSDVKPSNIWITEDGGVKLLDFGIARAAEPDSDTKFHGVDALTPPYAAPEMHRHEEPDPRDDVYGLACVAYELLTRAHPFDGKSGLQAETQDLEPERPKGLKLRQWRALERALSFQRAQRTPSVARFLEEFAPKRKVGPLAIASAAAMASALVATAVGFAVGLFGSPSTSEAEAYVDRLLELPVRDDLSRSVVESYLREGMDYTGWGREDLAAGEYHRGNAQLKNGASTAFRPFYTVLEGTRDASKRHAAAMGILAIDRAYVAEVQLLVEANMLKTALWLTCQGLAIPPGAQAPRWHELSGLYAELWPRVKNGRAPPIDTGCAIEEVPHAWGDGS